MTNCGLVEVKSFNLLKSNATNSKVFTSKITFDGYNAFQNELSSSGSRSKAGEGQVRVRVRKVRVKLVPLSLC